MPEITGQAIDRGNAQHAQKHEDCTKDKVLGLLWEKGPSVENYIRGLGDADLDRTASFAAVGDAISVQQFIENIIIHSGTEHLGKMKSAIS